MVTHFPTGFLDSKYKCFNRLLLFFKGFAFAQSTVKDDVRYSTNKAYLRPIRFRRNLHVTTKSHVTKVILDQDGKAAVGVEFKKNGRMYQVKANKEVILSAGTVASPQILMVIK